MQGSPRVQSTAETWSGSRCNATAAQLRVVPYGIRSGRGPLHSPVHYNNQLFAMCCMGAPLPSVLCSPMYQRRSTVQHRACSALVLPTVRRPQPITPLWSLHCRVCWRCKLIIRKQGYTMTQGPSAMDLGPTIATGAHYTRVAGRLICRLGYLRCKSWAAAQPYLLHPAQMKTLAAHANPKTPRHTSQSTHVCLTAGLHTNVNTAAQLQQTEAKQHICHHATAMH